MLNHGGAGKMAKLLGILLAHAQQAALPVPAGAAGRIILNPPPSTSAMPAFLQPAGWNTGGPVVQPVTVTRRPVATIIMPQPRPTSAPAPPPPPAASPASYDYDGAWWRGEGWRHTPPWQTTPSNLGRLVGAAAKGGQNLGELVRQAVEGDGPRLYDKAH